MKKKNSRGRKKQPPKKINKPTKKPTAPKKVTPKQGKRATKPAIKKSYKLYSKGKPLDKFFTGAVEKIAAAAGADVRTPKKLHKFYTDNYEQINTRLSKGETTFKRGTPEAIDNLEKLDSRGQEIYVQIGEGKNKRVTLENAVYEITMTERYLNRLLDTTGFTISFVRSYDGKVNIKLPNREESPEWAEYDLEDLLEYLLDEYNIIVYVSEPTKTTSDEKREQIKGRKQTYAARIEERKFIAVEAVAVTKSPKKKRTNEKKKGKRRK